eukprot:93087-Amphidinium_carterae.1
MLTSSSFCLEPTIPSAEFGAGRKVSGATTPEKVMDMTGEAHAPDSANDHCATLASAGMLSISD